MFCIVFNQQSDGCCQLTENVLCNMHTGPFFNRVQISLSKFVFVLQCNIVRTFSSFNSCKGSGPFGRIRSRKARILSFIHLPEYKIMVYIFSMVVTCFTVHSSTAFRFHNWVRILWRQFWDVFTHCVLRS